MPSSTVTQVQISNDTAPEEVFFYIKSTVHKQNICARMFSSTVCQIQVFNDTAPEEVFLAHVISPNVQHFMGTQQ